MKLVGQAKRTQFITCAVNGEAGLKTVRDHFEGQWHLGAEAWDTLPEDIRGAPVPSWEFNGKLIRVGAMPYLKHIGNGYAIRENTGEVYAEEKGSVRDCLYTAD